MTNHAYEVKELCRAYADDKLTAEELLEGVLLLDETYFTTHGGDFKRQLETSLMARVSSSPRQRVDKRQAFFEVFYDYAVGLPHRANP